MPRSERCAECGKTRRQHGKCRRNKSQFTQSLRAGVCRTARESEFGTKRPDPPPEPIDPQETP